jgi:hypothetical protein
MKAEKAKIKINSYWIVYVHSLNEYEKMQEIYEFAGIKTKFEYIGNANSQAELVVWIDKKPTNFIKKRKKEYAHYG